MQRREVENSGLVATKSQDIHSLHNSEIPVDLLLECRQMLWIEFFDQNASRQISPFDVIFQTRINLRAAMHGDEDVGAFHLYD